MISAEEFKYFKALQPVFKEKFGDNNQPEIFNDMKELVGFLYIPLPIDTENHKRGLVGMITGFASLDYDKNYYEWQVKYTKNGWYKDYPTASSPTLALLKALAAQERIEV